MTDEMTPERAFERMGEAIDAFGVAMWEVIIPTWDDIRETVTQLWLALARAYLAGRWRLGRLAWHLPDWIVWRVCQRSG